MTMDLPENELKMSAYLTDRFGEIIERMGAKQVVKQPRKGPYDITKYQTSIYAAAPSWEPIRATAH
jgi:gluconate 2-dehydrogenase alpha chain